MGDDRERMLSDLAPVLMEGELVEDLTSCIIEVGRPLGVNPRRVGILAVTNRRVICFSKRFGRSDLKDFAFGLLTSVDHKRSWVNGELNLAASGERIHIFNIPKEDVERVAQAIRTRMATHTSVTREDEPERELDLLKKLSELRDAGILTEEEFQRKKAQIMSL